MFKKNIMRKYVVILLSLVYASNIVAQNDLEKMHLKGKVKSVKTKFFIEKQNLLNNHILFNDFKEESKLEFNEDGYIIKDIDYRENGDVKRLNKKSRINNKLTHEYTVDYLENGDKLVENYTNYKENAEYGRLIMYIDGKQVKEEEFSLPRTSNEEEVDMQRWWYGSQIEEKKNLDFFEEIKYDKCGNWTYWSALNYRQMYSKIPQRPPGEVEMLKVMYREIEYYEPCKSKSDVVKEYSGPALFYVDKMPEFPGGKEALKTFIQESIIYPKEEMEQGMCGKIYVSFIVETDGNLSNVKVVRGLTPMLDREGERVIKSMPQWTPGSDKGKPSRVQLTIPIEFVINN